MSELQRPMTPTADARPVRRVLVAMDTSPGSRAAAEAATQLAALLQAELAGIFIEDRDLLDLSRSPMARQADLLTASVSRVESGEVEHQFRVQAERARSTLAAVAARADLAWSFRVARGTVAGEIHQASTDADLISLGRIGWSLRRRRLLGRTARRLLAHRRRRILLIDRSLDLRRPVLVVYDGSAPARSALQLATQLQAGGDGTLLVALPEFSPERRQEVAEIVHGGGSTIHQVGSGPAGAVRLEHLAQSRRCGLVILPLGGGLLDEDRLQELLDRLQCPILIVS